MKKIIVQYLFAALAVMLLLASCGVKDPIFNTPHPGHGMITLTADWRDIGLGLAAPASYTFQSEQYSASLSGVTNKLDHLFGPGAYRAFIYNTPDGITVSGSTAAVTAAEPPAGLTGSFIYGSPGWLFTCAMNLAIESDKEYVFTARMQQQIRQLTLVVEPTGDAIQRIEHITATLSGVAGTLDYDNHTHGAPSKVALKLAKITEGTNAGKWAATVWLLGITGTEQRLTGTIDFAGGTPAKVNFDSDLSAVLAGFNSDKRNPLTLEGVIAETSVEAGFTASIKNWIQVTGGTVAAD